MVEGDGEAERQRGGKRDDRGVWVSSHECHQSFRTSARPKGAGFTSEVKSITVITRAREGTTSVVPSRAGELRHERSASSGSAAAGWPTLCGFRSSAPSRRFCGMNGWVRSSSFLALFAVGAPGAVFAPGAWLSWGPPALFSSTLNSELCTRSHLQNGSRGSEL